MKATLCCQCLLSSQHAAETVLVLPSEVPEGGSRCGVNLRPALPPALCPDAPFSMATGAAGPSAPKRV